MTTCDIIFPLIFERQWRERRNLHRWIWFFNLGVSAYYHLGCIWILGLNDVFLFSFSFFFLSLSFSFHFIFFFFFGFHDFCYYTVYDICMYEFLSRQHNWQWCNMNLQVCLAACYRLKSWIKLSFLIFYFEFPLFRSYTECMHVCM